MASVSHITSCASEIASSMEDNPIAASWHQKRLHAPRTVPALLQLHVLVRNYDCWKGLLASNYSTTIVHAASSPGLLTTVGAAQRKAEKSGSIMWVGGLFSFWFGIFFFLIRTGHWHSDDNSQFIAANQPSPDRPSEDPAAKLPRQGCPRRGAE